MTKKESGPPAAESDYSQKTLDFPKREYYTKIQSFL